jgi:signal transduction histidine kinase
MLKVKNSLNKEILKYFLIFSIVILGMLWIFQFLFFNYFYKSQKTNDIKAVAAKIQKYQNNKNFEEIVNSIALDKSICIEMADKNYNLLYSSSYFGKGCVSSKESTLHYKFDFINSNQDENFYELTNPTYNNDTLVYALKLQNDKYVFINTSLEPVDGTISLLRKELIVISMLLLALSIVLAYFISNYIASPIKKINNEAKKLAKGNFDLEFKNDSNILEINELSETLNYAKDELNKTEEYRRDLMANVSHDLKTPLTMIKAYAEIAKDLHQNNKEKQEEDMETIIKETDRLTILVNDILTLSKMQSNIENLEYTSFDLIELIDEILKRYSLYQETENYKFIFNHTLKKAIIEADKVKLEQVIYNLINNAINYTGDDNTVIINILKDKNKNIRVEIKDSGKGIKDEDLPYIWDKYYKNKKKHKRNLIGTGLGLSIVKNIFELHNYEYGVISEKDKGTCFYFIINNSKEK